MRRISFIFILLFSFLLLFVSCSNIDKFYEEENYIKVLELLKNKKNLNKNDYLMKINSLINLGRKEEARESVMLYLLLSDETDNRSDIVNIFADYNFSSILTLLLLKDSDGINAHILRYIAYAELDEDEKAKEILANYLSSELSIVQFATLIVAHPIDENYTYSFFNSWYKVINESEKKTFFSLFLYYARLITLEDNLKSCLLLLNKFESDSFFTNSNSSLALLYKIEGILCYKLNDEHNASIFWKKSYKYNPNDEEILSLIK